MKKIGFHENRLAMRVRPSAPKGGEGWVNFDFFGDAAKGIGDGVRGIGKAFEALGSVVHNLGEGVNWLVKKGPKALFLAFLKGKNFGSETWESLNEPDLPEEFLPEYYDIPLPSKLTADKKLLEKQEHDAWTKRRDRLQAAVELKKEDHKSDFRELSFLNKRLQQLKNARVSQLVLQDYYGNQLESLDERKELGGGIAATQNLPPNLGLVSKENELNASYKELDESIDLGNQGWYIFDEETGEPKIDGHGKMMTTKVDILQRKQELELKLSAPSAQITFWEQQIEAIEWHKLGGKIRAQVARDGEEKEISDDVFDDSEGKTSSPTPTTPGTTGTGGGAQSGGSSGNNPY